MVHLRVLFGVDGKVKQIKVMSGLPYGLTENAVRTVNRIKAKPAKNNGEPIEYWMDVECEFRIQKMT
jgi:Gram-negative bacterial TonB protein C-terminal